MRSSPWFLSRCPSFQDHSECYLLLWVWKQWPLVFSCFMIAPFFFCLNQSHFFVFSLGIFCEFCLPITFTVLHYCIIKRSMSNKAISLVLIVCGHIVSQPLLPISLWALFQFGWCVGVTQSIIGFFLRKLFHM